LARNKIRDVPNYCAGGDPTITILENPVDETSAGPSCGHC